ncbi:MAG: PAS domain S-box protein [Ginsengibacter sp.]
METLRTKSPTNEEYKFLAGGGEMGMLTRNKDWSTTPVGNIEGWPQSLRTTLGIILNSKFPMFLWWGPELVCFYNDAYRPSLGENGKHPFILGQRAEEAWPEIWEIIQPLINKVLSGGEATWSEDQLIPIYRNGKIEDVYWTFSYSPVIDELGHIAGVLVTCSETTEKVNAFRSLEESKARYFNNIMQAPVAMCIFRGKQHTVEVANDMMLELWGKTSMQVINKPIFEGLPEAGRQGLEQMLDNIYTTGEKFVANEWRLTLPRNGNIETTYMNFVCEALKETDGTISGIVAIASEVTMQVLARKRIEESEEIFRTMAEGTDILISVSDTAGNFTYFNKAWSDLTGRATTDLLQSGWSDLIHPDDRENYILNFQKAFKKRALFAGEYRVLNKEGDYHWLLIKAPPRFKTDGTFEGFIAACVDIHERVIYQDKLKENEERLKESAERLTLATEGTQQATWDLNLQTYQIIHSPRLAQIFGHEETKILTHPGMRGQIHPDDIHTIVEKAFEIALQTGTYYYQARVIHPDKTIRWIRTRGKVIFDKNRSPLRMLGTLMDITDSQVAEENTARMAAIVHSSDDAIISKNLDGIVKTWNAGAERIFGYTAEEMIGQSLMKLIPSDKSDEEPNILSLLKKGHRVDHFETKRITKDNKILDVSLTISPVRDSHDNIIGASKIARDITKQKEAEQLIITSEQKFRLLADSMPQFIWTSDAEGNLNYFNKAVFDYAGLMPGEMQKDGWLQIVHPEDREENTRIWQESVNTGKDFIFEHRFRRYDGECRWQLSRAIPQKGPTRKIQMWVGTSTDIQAIKEQDQQKDYFISMASHELKTPITSIKGYVQILQTMHLNSEDAFLKKSLNIIDKQIGTLTNLISDLLDVSKIKTGNLSLKKEPFQLQELIVEIADEIRHVNPGYSVCISTSSQAIVYADRERIGQVLINFLTNAIKYSPGSNEVRIESAVADDNIIVSVKDSGIGINKQDQQKIFERFYRVEGKNEKTFPGFGIGLFIASEIIRRHDGNIGVESESGKGSVFYFSLPRIIP